MLAYAFLARVLRITRASLDRVLSKMALASLRSYREGSCKEFLTVVPLNSEKDVGEPRSVGGQLEQSVHRSVGEQLPL